MLRYPSARPSFELHAHRLCVYPSISIKGWIEDARQSDGQAENACLYVTSPHPSSLPPLLHDQRGVEDFQNLLDTLLDTSPLSSTSISSPVWIFGYFTNPCPRILISFPTKIPLWIRVWQIEIPREPEPELKSATLRVRAASPSFGSPRPVQLCPEFNFICHNLVLKLSNRNLPSDKFPFVSVQLEWKLIYCEQKVTLSNFVFHPFVVEFNFKISFHFDL